mmetsp:Transcript_17237/g.31453  ORF Transcript_17237/g.31453 Transcript_17237/m.31453 type:complete len:93 (-) Transcript_17237:1289-1567(-)
MLASLILPEWPIFRTGDEAPDLLLGIGLELLDPKPPRSLPPPPSAPVVKDAAAAAAASAGVSSGGGCVIVAAPVVLVPVPGAAVLEGGTLNT